MGFGSFVKKATKSVTKAVTNPIDKSLGTDLGGVVDGGIAITEGMVTGDVGGMMSGAQGMFGSALSSVANRGEEEQTPQQVAATSQSKDIDKKKKELEGALFMNTAGTRQQSVLNPR